MAEMTPEEMMRDAIHTGAAIAVGLRTACRIDRAFQSTATSQTAHSYRQTRYGRVPRLDPLTRERQRLIRQRGGRR